MRVYAAGDAGGAPAVGAEGAHAATERMLAALQTQVPPRPRYQSKLSGQAA